MTRALPIRRSRAGFRGLAAAAALALAAACSGGSTPPTQNPPPPPPPGGGSGDVQIDMQNIAFKTSNGTDSITVAAGSTIQWTNLDQGIQHSATSDSVPSGASTFDSGLLGASQSFTYTVDTPGRYVYHCTVHPGQMAHAVIIAQ